MKTMRISALVVALFSVSAVFSQVIMRVELKDGRVYTYDKDYLLGLTHVTDGTGIENISLTSLSVDGTKINAKGCMKMDGVTRFESTYSDPVCSKYAFGICCSQHSSPTTADLVGTTFTPVSGEYSVYIDDLGYGRQYYVRPYFMVNGQTYYGKEQTVSTAAYQSSYATPALVDLGLSVKWATFDVGAASEGGSGLYFPWGETQPVGRWSTDWKRYVWYDARIDSIVRYNAADGLTRLSSSDDVCTSLLGSGFRLPTKAEVEELFAKTTMKRRYLGGNNVVTFTAANGNSISLIDDAGYMTSECLSGEEAYYYYVDWRLTPTVYNKYKYVSVFARAVAD